MSKLGKEIRQRREDLGISLNKAASKMCMSASSLHQIETGKNPRPKIATLSKISAFLDVDVDKLIILAEKIPPDVYWWIAKNPEMIEVVRNHREEARHAKQSN